MRFHRDFVTALGIAALVGGAAVPAFAQFGSLKESSDTQFQQYKPPVPDQPLAIPTPPQATVQVEVDLHDDDLLGVFKSLLRGVGQAANAAVPPATTATPGTTKTVSDAQLAAILSNADLSDVLKDVTHIHFILLTTPGGDAPAPPAAAPGAKARPTAPPPPVFPDQTAFYETAFATEGGHRIIYSNFDPVHIVMTSFGHAHGFAFMLQAPGSIAVFRADGYPDLSKLAALAGSIGAVVGKSAMTDLKIAPVPSAAPEKTIK